MRTHSARWMFVLLGLLVAVGPSLGCKSSSSWSMSSLNPWDSSDDNAIAASGSGGAMPSEIATAGLDITLPPESTAMASMPDRSSNTTYPSMTASYNDTSGSLGSAPASPYGTPTGSVASTAYTPQRGRYDTGSSLSDPRSSPYGSSSGIPGVGSPSSPSGIAPQYSAASDRYGSGYSAPSTPSSTTPSPYGVAGRTSGGNGALASQMFGGPSSSAGSTPSGAVDPFRSTSAPSGHLGLTGTSGMGSVDPRMGRKIDNAVDVIRGGTPNAVASTVAPTSPYRTSTPYTPSTSYTPPTSYTPSSSYRSSTPPFGSTAGPSASGGLSGDQVAQADIGAVEISQDYASAGSEAATGRYTPGNTGYTPGSTSYSPPGATPYSMPASQYSSTPPATGTSQGFMPGSTGRYLPSTSSTPDASAARPSYNYQSGGLY